MAAEFLERMGDRLRERREEMGLSRPEVARRMPGKVSENQIYRWEKGKHTPNPDTLEALACVLERDVAYFLMPPAEPAEPAEPSNGNAETPDLVGILEEETQLDRIESAVEDLEAKLDELLDRLVADGVLQAVEQDAATEQPPEDAKRRRPAS